MLNHIVLMGRLTRDPELRRTTTDTPVSSFTLAVDRDYSKNDETVDFIDIVAWRQTAEFVQRYFKKGRMAVVEGRLQIREWNDKYGNKRRNAEVVADKIYFGDSKKSDDTRPVENEDFSETDVENEDFSEIDDDDDFSEIDDNDDDLPF